MPRNILKYIFVFTIAVYGCGNNNPASTEKEAPAPAPEKKATAGSKTILFFGNSLTAGYGLDAAEAFPALIQKKIDSLHRPFKVINAGLSGETSSGGLARINWLIQQKIDVFVLELGANDGLRGIPVTETHKNLQSIIDTVKGKYPSIAIILAGMQVPPNMGKSYATAFISMYKELAKQNNSILMPFLLEGVGGDPALNQADGIHPTAEGHKIIAANLWTYLNPVLQ